MQKAILKILNVEPSESVQVYLLLAQGFFVGIFLASFTVASETLFLNNFSEENDLPYAFVCSGIVGIILTYLFSYLQNKISYKKLALGYLIFIAIVISLLKLGLVITEVSKTFIFISFVLAVPLDVLLLLLFWGTFNRMFSLRQAKRIIGGIDTGMLIASVSGFFSIPFIIKLLSSVSELFYISLVAILLNLVVVYITTVKFDLNLAVQQTTKKIKKATSAGFLYFFQNRYLFLMVLFVTLCMISVSFLDYSFYTVAGDYFINDQDLAIFLSFFDGTIVIFSFGFQTFVTDKIISDYGLKVSLLINPVLLAIFAVVATAIGASLGFEKGSDQIIFFFVAIAGSKLFIDSLRDALDGPSFKLYFLPINSSIRLDVQSKIEGVVTVFSGIISGGLIILINNLKILNVLQITIFLFPILALWYIVVVKMHGKYKDTLHETLEENKEISEKEVKKTFAIDQLLQRELLSNIPDKIIYALRLMEKVEPVLFEASLMKLKDSQNAKVKAFALEKLENLEVDLKNIKNKLPEKSHSIIRILALEAAQLAESNDIISISTARLNELAKSKNVYDRVFTAKLLRKTISDENIFILLELLRDININVRIAAINTCRKVQRPEVWTLLIEMLAVPYYSHAAAAALYECGDKVLFTLETAFHKSGQKAEIKNKIVQIFGKIGSSRSIKLLWEKIEYPDKKIVSQVVNSLKYWTILANEEQAIKVNNLLDKELSATLWNLAAISEIKVTPENRYLLDALKDEVDLNYDRIYTLLSLIYDPYSVQLVRDNIESGTNEGVAFALELCDIFIDIKLKPKLFPILDDISVADKIEQLQHFYHREKYSELEVMIHMVNRDYNHTSNYTKACALRALYYNPEISITDDVVAHLFNPDPLIRETAAWFIYSLNKKMLDRIIPRVADNIKKEVESVLFNEENSINSRYLRMEKIMFLKKIPVFENIPGYIIANLAEVITEIKLGAGIEIPINEHFENSSLYIIAEGIVQVKGGDQYTRVLKEKDLFGELMVIDSELKELNVVCVEPTILFKLEKDNFFEVMMQYNELAQEFLKLIQNMFEPEVFNTIIDEPVKIKLENL
jgi:ATP:ADP antiporter, AAA family